MHQNSSMQYFTAEFQTRVELINIFHSHGQQYRYINESICATAHQKLHKTNYRTLL